MTDISGFVPGWVSDPSHVSNSIEQRVHRGDAVMGESFVARHANELPGTWKRMVAAGHTGVFLRDQELKVNGGYRRPAYQNHGTCVSRAVYRGCQTSLDVAISLGNLSRPVELSFAPIYTLARHECGHDRCGSGDGAIMADAMRAIHDYGVATTALFPGMKETQVEELAVRYAAPGVGTPSSWVAACNGHTAITFWPESLELLFDCIAAGYAVPYAHNWITGMPNASGISTLGSCGSHARCFVGVFLDEHGETQLESSESWGRYPAGQPQEEDRTMPVERIPRVNLRYAGGERLLPPGDVGVNAKKFYEAIRSGGEAWAVGAPEYRPTGVAELARKVVS